LSSCSGSDLFGNWRSSTTADQSVPDHAMRVLRDLAEFEVGKPAEYNDAIVEAAKRCWQRLSSSARSILGPCCLRRERQPIKDFTITFSRFR